MAVYLFMISWCLLWGHLLDKKYKYKNETTKRIISVLPILVIFLVSALRYDVGDDYSGTYTSIYRKLMVGNVDKRVEFLVMLIYKLIVFFDLNLQWFFVISSFIISYFVYRCIDEQSEYKKLSYFIFICGTFLFFSYNGVRQAIAMSLFYFSLKYIMGESDKKKGIVYNNCFRYIVVNSVAFLNHMSSVIFIPMYFSLKKIISTRVKLLTFFFLYFFNGLIIPYLTVLLMKTKFSLYINNMAFRAEDKMNLSMILNLVLLILYEYILHRDDKCSEKDIIYDNIHFYGAIVSTFVTTLPLVLRLFMCFRYIEFLSVPNLITHGKAKYRKLIIIAVYFVYFMYFIVMVGMRNGNKALPYRTFWSR